MGTKIAKGVGIGGVVGVLLVALLSMEISGGKVCVNVAAISESLETSTSTTTK